jgi:hypothetical protein
VIERIFGVLKKRFRILLLAQEYPFITQAQMVAAVAALHNFIILHDPSEISSREVDTEPNVDDFWSMHQATVPREERTRAAERRDRIAMAMWEDYVARSTRRRR